MSRPKIKNSELLTPFTSRIKEFFPGKIREGKEALGFSSWSDSRWYSAVQGGPLTCQDAYDIEQAVIQFAIKENKPREVIKSLRIQASPDRNKDPQDM